LARAKNTEHTISSSNEEEEELYC